MRRSWRWFVVASAMAVLVALPPLVATFPVHTSSPAPAPRVLLQRMVGSTAQPYQGYAVSEGNLALPKLPFAGDVTSLLSDTTYLRAWYASPDRWRVDRLSAFGEIDTYLEGVREVTWDSQRHRLALASQPSDLRLLQPSDLLPPELGRRLARAALDERAPARLSPIPARRVAGVAAAGVRVVPGSREATTISEVDLWADPRTGLPVEASVRAVGAAHPVLTTKFLDLRTSMPAADLVTFHPAQGEVQRVEERGRHSWSGAERDVVSSIEQFSPVVLPSEIGSRPRRSGTGLVAATGVATYGTGFGVVAVAGLPAEGGDLASALQQLPAVSTPAGPARAVTTPLLNGVVVNVGQVEYFLVGTVPLHAMTQLVASLPSTVAPGPGTR